MSIGSGGMPNPRNLGLVVMLGLKHLDLTAISNTRYLVLVAKTQASWVWQQKN